MGQIIKSRVTQDCPLIEMMGFLVGCDELQACWVQKASTMVGIHVPHEKNQHNSLSIRYLSISKDNLDEILFGCRILIDETCGSVVNELQL
jgi:hypothetical protein